MTIKPDITFINNILKKNELMLASEYDLLGIIEFYKKRLFLKFSSFGQ